MDRSELLTSLGVLFAGFPGGKPIDPRLASEIVRPLEAFPDDAVNAAIWNFRNAKVEGMSLNYPPSIPSLVAETRRVASEQAHEAWMESRKALPAPAEPVVDEAMRKRIGVRMVELAEQMGAGMDASRTVRAEKRRQHMTTVNDRFLSQDERSVAERLRFNELGLKTGT